MRRLTRSQARRAAIAAAGLARPRPARADVRHFRRVVRDLDVVQLDSVNVLARAHELLFFARIGAHDVEALRRWLWTSREMLEGWVHVASLVPMETEPLHRFRQRGRWEDPGAWAQKVTDAMPGYGDRVRDEVERDGPLRTSDLSDPGERTEGMWGWSPGRKVLHHLFSSGRIAIHERTPDFVPWYAAVDDVVPPEVRDLPDTPRDVAHERLLVRAARAQGWGTAKSLRDHHRLPYLAEVREAIARLEARGELVRIDVEGVDAPTWAHPDMVVPRSVTSRALLCPFDPLVWFRDRIEELWDFHYRIEIYTPEAQREYGYYVLPYLLGERLVGRVDLKADRQAGELQVRGAWAEADVDVAHAAGELRDELDEMASWLGLDTVTVTRKGSLATAL